jgi:hypothetical protein
MATDIKCPNCGHQFPMGEAVSEEYKKELRDQMLSYKKQKEEELAKIQKEFLEQANRRENEFNQKLQDEKKLIQQNLETQLRKNISGEFENSLRMLEQQNKDQEEKLRSSRQKEMEFLKKEQELLNQQAEMELNIQRRLQEERSRLSEEIRKVEEQKVAVRESENSLRMRELEKQLEDQKKLAEEMRRKAEQGSMQLQGEVQELALEELLQTSYPFDIISEVGKGVRGADCIQTIRNNLGQECGKMIYESKRTKDFGGDWIEKIKKDMRSQGADVAIIVTQAMPRDMAGFGEKDGVWICRFEISEIRALTSVLRESIIKVHTIAKNHQNSGDKMQLLYSYLTSHEFTEQWKAIREGFMSMKISIQRERDAMEKLWKAREKQLEKVLVNAAHIRGSIDGIAGQNTIDLNLDFDQQLLEE